MVTWAWGRWNAGVITYGFTVHNFRKDVVTVRLVDGEYHFSLNATVDDKPITLQYQGNKRHADLILIAALASLFKIQAPRIPNPPKED